MSYYAEQLPAEQFIRIYRSYLVAVTKINVLTESHLEVPGQTLPIGRKYQNQVFGQLKVRHLLRSPQA
ncbi:LytTR family transcriptional regulator DNA-binding domain-containing protein [Spirosoma telluris]|uniref:LytTR family transcriptional regulator DNA-binding domain-containing protein n=1 Tax=Spirosoma telluris TaxID=2183553 RepID=UPI0038CD3919